MSEYVHNFSLVEVQHTFYQPPKPETLEKWRADVPADFEFTLKAWQLITHESRSPTYKRLKRKLTEKEAEDTGAFRWTPIVREAWKTTLECARILKAKRVLFQCPARFTPTDSNLANFRKFMKKISTESKDLILMWEPRGEWPSSLVKELCGEFNLIHVVDPLAARSVSDEKYYRLHGRRGRDYEDEELEELYEMLPEGRVNYVLFNNVRMVRDAFRFREIARKAEGFGSPADPLW
jgi:uncharacterized protein YecE (DUF72 family)